MNNSEFEPAPGRHVWLTGELRRDRLAAQGRLQLPPALLPVIAAHRHLRGPYTAAGALLGALVPEAMSRRPDLVSRHEIEILTAAPGLSTIVPATLQTLTSLAVPDERTRFYSGLRTLRLAHGLAEFIQEYLGESGLGGRSASFDDLDRADRTDQEFLAVLLRRIDPQLLTIVVGCSAELAAVEQPTGPTIRPTAGGLGAALVRYCQRIDSTPATSTVAGSDAELARTYVFSDGTEDDPVVVAGYHSLGDPERRLLHDERATELDELADPATARGAIPFHRLLGSQPLVEGARAVNHALNDCMKLGFYDATIELCERGRAIVDWKDNPKLRWLFTTKLPTSLSAIGRGDEAMAICNEARAWTQDPLIHRQLAYATSMLYIRHLDPEQRDTERALGWINEAVVISSLLDDPKEREFGIVFNQNGRALIEVRRGDAEAALDIVTAGIARLDAFLKPDEHLLHRSVLTYNRAQVLVGMERFDEALADYHAVMELDPNYPEYHFDVANLLHRLGRDDEALAEYETAMRLGPPFPELYYNRADLLAGMGDFDAALEGFSYVLELDPDYLDAYLNRAGLLADLGELAAAARDVEAGLALDDGNAHLLSLRGRLQLEAGQLDAARTSLDTAIVADPALSGAWALRGAVEFESGDLNGALRNLSTAVELSPDPAVLFNRGSVLQALGRWDEAAEDFDRVLLLDPDEADALLQRATCHAQLGNAVSA
ncbi:MAG: tetratricopeptide repeat protein [Actinomycetota bacterium]|nr:tetratricopeptide repeat protein [Actinomycetota bacterium]MDQ2955422.1 tetratricopeptide repeat protein [Actinomycetota bacterium]